MKPSHIEHIGIAVKNLEEAIRFYERIIGLNCYKIEEVPEQKVRIAFLKAGDTKIELLEPTDQDGPVGKFISGRGEGLHHIAFSVSDINASLEHAAGEGVRLIDKVPRRGADELEIAFLHPASSNGVLVEFCNSGKK